MKKDLEKTLFNGAVDQKTKAFIKKAKAFYKQNAISGKTMFGYPSHTVKLSPVTQYLLLEHYTSPFSNNCGDINERGNYSMDTKEAEKLIVGAFAEKLGLGENFWGYVTSGGTESNSCAVSVAFNKHPLGVLFYSEAAHYSVAKAAKLYRHVEIPVTERDQINTSSLFNAIRKTYDKDGVQANIVLTHGTTLYGACDPIDEIVSFLINEKIPYFLHVDAALFGGIPNNQKGAPVLTDLKNRGVHSACVSLHKYVGFPDVHSVYVATEKPDFPAVSYIGQHDTTVSGSRSIPAYALLNHVREQLAEKNTGLYLKNVVVFTKMLDDFGVKYYRADKSNIFVIDRPSDELCKKYQLSCFDAMEGGVMRQKAHVIIFPHHKKSDMLALAKGLAE